MFGTIHLSIGTDHLTVQPTRTIACSFPSIGAPQWLRCVIRFESAVSVGGERSHFVCMNTSSLRATTIQIPALTLLAFSQTLDFEVLRNAALAADADYTTELTLRASANA